VLPTGETLFTLMLLLVTPGELIAWATVAQNAAIDAASVFRKVVKFTPLSVCKTKHENSTSTTNQ
jgi:hypothetical protein